MSVIADTHAKPPLHYAWIIAAVTFLVLLVAPESGPPRAC